MVVSTNKAFRTNAITVHSITFASKTALLTHIRYILSKYEPGEYLKGEHFDFIRSLINRHPYAQEKLRYGCAAIQVYQPQIWKGTRGEHKGFQIFGDKGEVTHFGFHQCVSPKDDRRRFIEACRDAVRSQVSDFSLKTFGANNGRVFCPCEQREITFEESHVDHYPVPFVDIVERFIVESQMEVESVAYLSMRVASKPQIADIDLKQSWQVFHKKTAQLRIVSAKANMKNGAKRAKS